MLIWAKAGPLLLFCLLFGHLAASSASSGQSCLLIATFSNDIFS